MDASFFHTDGTWFVPNDAARGPWSEDACHAGPVSGLLARALELLAPDKQLTRLAVEVTRPVPMGRIRIASEANRRGRTVSTTRAVLLDERNKECCTATGLHISASDLGEVPTAPDVAPVLADKVPGLFPIQRPLHQLPCFSHAVEVGFPPGETRDPGPTTMWMRTIPLLEDEALSGFQQLCPLADCGNGLSRNAEPQNMSFLNADLTIVMHRLPASEWLASRAKSYWQSSGIGLAEATLFDAHGTIASALQSLVLRWPEG